MEPQRTGCPAAVASARSSTRARILVSRIVCTKPHGCALLCSRSCARASSAAALACGPAAAMATAAHLPPAAVPGAPEVAGRKSQSRWNRSDVDRAGRATQSRGLDHCSLSLLQVNAVTAARHEQLRGGLAPQPRRLSRKPQQSRRPAPRHCGGVSSYAICRTKTCGSRIGREAIGNIGSIGSTGTSGSIGSIGRQMAPHGIDELAFPCHLTHGGPRGADGTCSSCCTRSCSRRPSAAAAASWAACCCSTARASACNAAAAASACCSSAR